MTDLDLTKLREMSDSLWSDYSMSESEDNREESNDG